MKGRLTEAQRRAIAYKVAVARASAELDFSTSMEVANYIGMNEGNFSREKKLGFPNKGLEKFCMMVKKLDFTDEEILRIVKAKQ